MGVLDVVKGPGFRKVSLQTEEKGMGDLLKGVTFSFIIHALVFLTVTGISGSVVPMSKPIVIDFTIEDPEGDKEVTLHAAPRLKGHEKITNHSPAKEEKPKIQHEEKVYESPVVLSISDAQISVPAPSSGYVTDSAGGGNSSAVQGVTDGSSAGIGSSMASTGGSGDSAEKAGMRYLKAHFAYIRDLIRKNISYPYIARRMGWEGKVTVSFVVSENGYIDNIKIKETSGFEILDKNAIETIKKVCPFPKPSVEALIVVPIVYRLN